LQEITSKAVITLPRVKALTKLLREIQENVEGKEVEKNPLGKKLLNKLKLACSQKLTRCWEACLQTS